MASHQTTPATPTAKFFSKVRKEARAQSQRTSYENGPKGSLLYAFRANTDTHKNTPSMKATKEVREKVSYSMHFFESRTVRARSYDVAYIGITDRLWPGDKSHSKAFARAQLVSNVIAKAVPKQLHENINVRADFYNDVDGTTEDDFVKYFMRSPYVLCLNKKKGNDEPGKKGYRHLYVVSFGVTLCQTDETLQLNCGTLNIVDKEPRPTPYFFYHCTDYTRYKLYINSIRLAIEKRNKGGQLTVIQRRIDELVKAAKESHKKESDDSFAGWSDADYKAYFLYLVQKDATLIHDAKTFKIK